MRAMLTNCGLANRLMSKDFINLTEQALNATFMLRYILKLAEFVRAAPHESRRSDQQGY